ncbi:MAG: hypothetical protein IJ160_09970 [Muribaculaceae bacterium]|nr:hypothetical protein [Muribaculaceae bacterium]
MRRILTFIILPLLVMAVLSCRDQNRRILEMADEVIYTAPDSSLDLLRSLDTASLGNVATRAYYALLWTQTAYRTGRFELASDSLANAALSYYRQYGKDNERLVRAMIYMGLHCEVHGQPEQAMALYKEAEATVDKTDWRNLAQVNYRIAQLLSNFSVQNNEDLRRFERALYYYNMVGDTLQIIYSLLGTGALQRRMGIDSARRNLERAYRLARQCGDSANCARSLEYLARGFLKDSIHETAKELATYCVRHYPTAQYAVDAMLDAACAYALMGRNDSAQYYLDMASRHDDNEQRASMRLFCLKTIAKNHHDIVDYIAYSEQREQLHDSLRANAVIARLLTVDRQGDVRQRQHEHQRDTARFNWLLLAILAGLMVMAGLGYMIHQRNIRQYAGLKMQIDQLKEEQILQQQMFEHNRQSDMHLNQRLTELLSVYSGLCNRLINMSNEYPEKVFYKQFMKEVEAFTERGELINELQRYIDDNNDGAISNFLNEHPDLDEKERGMVILTALGMRSSSIAVCLGLKNDSVVRALRHRLAKRLGLDMTLVNYLGEMVKNRPFL